MTKQYYFIPGMGTTKEVFKGLDFKGDSVHYLEFPEPLKDESLKDYSARMAEVISDENENILIGMSMGGFIAQEISLIKKVEKIKQRPRAYVRAPKKNSKKFGRNSQKTAFLSFFRCFTVNHWSKVKNS